eukprot:gene12086-20331_t
MREHSEHFKQKFAELLVCPCNRSIRCPFCKLLPVSIGPSSVPERKYSDLATFCLKCESLSPPKTYIDFTITGS